MPLSQFSPSFQVIRGEGTLTLDLFTSRAEDSAAQVGEHVSQGGLFAASGGRRRNRRALWSLYSEI